MTTLSREFPIARQPHRCGSCDGPIHAGDRYHRWTGTGDEWTGIARLKECMSCVARYARRVPSTSKENADG